MGKRVVFWLLPLCVGCAVLSPPAEPAKPQAAEDAKPQAAEDTLKLAAECLERGDDAAALPHLARYVAAHPDHAAIRLHLAELRLRRGNRTAARREFEQYLADAEELDDHKHLIHVHTRLFEIATADGDEYAERLHRGIGLFLLAKQVQA